MTRLEDFGRWCRMADQVQAMRYGAAEAYHAARTHGLRTAQHAAECRINELTLVLYEAGRRRQATNPCVDRYPL